MDCNSQEVQRITTVTSTYKRFYTRILIMEIKLERTKDGFEKWETFQRIIDWIVEGLKSSERYTRYLTLINFLHHFLSVIP